MSSEWIKHDSAPCPVPKGTIVDIRCKNGYEHYGVAAGIKLEALSLFWQGSGTEFDIIEYRILEALEWQIELDAENSRRQ